ncbi:hypothetical protein TELCIR_11804, partial [Teladorsagia circumcincta]
MMFVLQSKRVYMSPYDATYRVDFWRFSFNHKEVPRLDILICNAGVLRVPKFAKTVDGFERTWQCNYL